MTDHLRVSGAVCTLYLQSSPLLREVQALNHKGKDRTSSGKRMKKHVFVLRLVLTLFCSCCSILRKALTELKQDYKSVKRAADNMPATIKSEVERTTKQVCGLSTACIELMTASFLAFRSA